MMGSRGPGLSLRAKVILAIVVLQVAMIGIFVSFHTLHEHAVVRKYVKEANVAFATNLAHAFAPLVLAKDSSLLQRCATLVLQGEDIRYVIVEDRDGTLLARATRGRLPLALSGASQNGSAVSVREVGREAGTLPFLPAVTYEIAAPIVVLAERVGTVRLAVSTARMTQQVWAGTIRGLWLITLALGAAVALAVAVDRRLRHALQELIRVTHQMAAGDLTKRVRIRTADELQVLGDAFNRMADNLARSQQMLQEWGRDLEAKVRDRTRDLEEEKQKLDGIVSGIGAGLLLLDCNMRIVWTNRLLAQWFGLQDQALSQPCRAVAWKEAGPCADCPSQRTLRSGKIEQAEQTIAFPDGRRRFFQVTSSPIRNEAGEVVQVLELIQDITEKKLMEAQLIHAGKLVAMGELASGIAHEINNPVAIIAAHAERMLDLANQRDIPSARRYEKFPLYLETVRKHSFRCKEIIDKLLNFARRRDPDPQPTDVNAVLGEAISLVKNSPKAVRGTIVRELAEPLPPVIGDPDALQQVFLNLLANALDAIEGPGQVAVRSGVEDSSVVVEISDTGEGIPDEDLGRIFEPFFTTKLPGKGTGLGLAICARIIERAGGEIQVESLVGRGTTFTVRLPLDPRAAPASAGVRE